MAVIFLSLAPLLFTLTIIQLADGTQKDEMSTYIDLRKEDGQWRVKNGLLSQSEFASGETPAGFAGNTYNYTEMSIAKCSAFVVQTLTTAEIEKFLEGPTVGSIMESLSALLFSDVGSFGEPPVLMTYFQQFTEHKLLKQAIPPQNMSSLAVIAGAFPSDATAGKLYHIPPNLVLYAVANNSAVSIKNGINSVWEIRESCESGTSCRSEGTHMLPDTTKIDNFRFSTAVGHETTKGFIFTYDGVQYEEIKDVLSNKTNGVNTDELTDVDVRRQTGVVIRFILQNQEDAANSVYTFVQSCTGTIGDTMPNCTHVIKTQKESKSQSAVQTPMLMTILAELVILAFNPLHR